ncbi:MAG: inorganic phosphate transporter, partial [Planctomycetota bacterium]|nr:inorganic phosphate transporter [Planctomycetota bacterium]
MTTLALATLILTVIFALVFNLTNGWNDAANAVATVISTRVLSPAKAIAFGAVLNFVGALFSSEVARTVGHSIAAPEYLTGATFLAAVMAAPVWITWCSRRGLPNSCSHALLGALIGSVIASSGGFEGLNPVGIHKIVFGVIICPIAGFIMGYIIVRIATLIARNATPSMASSVFGRLQLVSAGAMAIAHGTGDGQKAMGIISGALLTAGVTHPMSENDFVIPFWVRIVCALTMALGTSLGGWRVMKTLGSRLAHLRTYQGFSAETAAATTILMNTLGGIPISTTHSITGAIMGVGAAQGVKAVKWGVGKKIVFAWIVTFPICIVAGG